MTVKVISLAAIFVFIRSSEDYVRYMLVIVLTTGANYIINMLQLRKFGIRLTCHGIKILPHMKPIFIMLGTTVAIELYTMLDTTWQEQKQHDLKYPAYDPSTRFIITFHMIQA